MAQLPPPMQGIDAAIDELATRFAVPPSEVQQLLWEHIRTLERSARIKQFVALLAIKHARETLRKQDLPQPSMAQDAP